MAKYAVIENGKVAIVAEADSALEPNWVLLPANSPVWVGYTYENGVFTAPPAPPAPPAPANAWWMYPGPFKDRLGADALAIAASTHGACKAVTEMLNGRLYVDLQSTQAAQMLDLLIANNQPTADAMFAGSGTMTAAKKETILTTAVPEKDRYRG